MSEERPRDLLGGMPRTRPHRRSQKRPARAAGEATPARTPTTSAKWSLAATPDEPASRAKGAPAARKPTRNARGRGTPPRGRPRLAQPAQPAGTPRVPRREIPASPPAATDVLSTAVKAVGEIAQIGAALGARALRNGVRRLPRP